MGPDYHGYPLVDKFSYRPSCIARVSIVVPCACRRSSCTCSPGASPTFSADVRRYTARLPLGKTAALPRHALADNQIYLVLMRNARAYALDSARVAFLDIVC